MKYMPRKKIWSGSNRKNTFNAETFEGRSYGHWLYVMKAKGGKVLFNWYRYSVTTTGHQYEMASFLRSEFGIKESDIIRLDQHASLDRGIFMDTQYERLFLAEVRSKRKGMRAEFLKTQLETIKQMKAEIKVLRKLGAKTSYPVDEIKARVTADETKRLETNREESRKMRELKKQLMTEVKDQFDSVEAVAI